MLKILGSVLIVAAVWALLSFMVHRSIYYPLKHPHGLWELSESLGASDVWLKTADGVRIHGWWVNPHGAHVATLLFHGNAGNLTHRSEHIREITSAGSALLIIDYRGYGRSQGTPTESGLYADGDAAYRYLLEQGWKPAQIILHGESLGTTVAVDLASRLGCGGVILEAPFTSARAVAARVLPLVGPLLVWGFDSKSKIAGVKAPVLIIHGDRDEVIDFTFGRSLFDAAREPKYFWEVQNAGHNDIIDTAGPAYGARLREFYEKCIKWGNSRDQ